MAAYRFRDPAPVLDTLLGLTPAPGGKAYFYILNTTTPKNTYQDYALTTPNPNPVILDSNGRFPDPVWLDGDYTYKLDAADDSSIVNPTDIRPEIAPGLAIPSPTGHSGEYITTDGTNILWSGPIFNLPDPTGSPGDMVVVNSDGDGYILQAQPEIPEPDITVATTSFVAGGGDALKFQELWGTGSAPASGGQQTSLAVTFTTPFKSGTVPMVSITPTNSQAGGFVTWKIEGGATSTGFTVTFDVTEGNTGSPNFSAPQGFQFGAKGVIDG